MLNKAFGLGGVQAFRGHSIGTKIGLAMAVLALLVVANATIGVRGISSIETTLQQTSVATDVLVKVNTASGDVSEFILAKDPQKLIGAAASLDAAVERLSQPGSGGSAINAQIVSEIQSMAASIGRLEASQQEVEEASARFVEIADALGALAAQAEKAGVKVTDTAEREAGYVFLSIDRVRQVVSAASNVRAAGQEIKQILTDAGVSPEAVLPQLRQSVETAKPAMKTVVDLGGSPASQKTVHTLSKTFAGLEKSLAEGADRPGRAALLAAAGTLVTQSAELNDLLAQEAAAELEAKKETDNARSKARVKGGMLRNFAGLIQQAVSSADRFRLSPSDELAGTVSKHLEKASGFAKILGKMGEEALS